MLNVGTALTLESLEDDGEKYKCKIADIDEDKIYIDYPISLTTNRTAFLLNSFQLNAVFITENNVAYQFRTQVIGKIKKNIPLIILQLPPKETFKKIQRRQFVRVNAAIDISINCKESNCHFTTITEDVSAGGCAVLLPNNIKLVQNEIGNMILVLPMHSGEYHYIQTKFKIIRINEGEKNIASIEFIDIQEKDKQLLFRFCFEKQLELRKKGLLKN
ncbi:flagellar brake protein [Heyndrickxia sporothermodurans]|uniref:flagellar brake protein n=1 Tax=Heyndrickxia sporothermodurans TaxID=46224 RepID=UPI002E21D5E3|nr:flagellar brake domain-containing protein [Heyndrickxia sporothermodurans]MED3699191.1 flagellar brake domain-containing protein [Heyndrickxia sporothermodurans]